MAKFKLEDLEDCDRSYIVNGCGGKGGWVPVPNFQFKASCDRHDFGYWVGGDKKQRLYCDARFFGAMVTDAALLPPWKRPAHLLLSYVYFRAVRCFGGKFFHQGTPRVQADVPLFIAHERIINGFKDLGTD